MKFFDQLPTEKENKQLVTKLLAMKRTERLALKGFPSDEVLVVVASPTIVDVNMCTFYEKPNCSIPDSLIQKTNAPYQIY